MASSNSQDDSIELFEIISTHEGDIEITPPLPRKPKRRSKIPAPSDLFTVASEIENIESIESVEEIKPKPVPAPRKSLKNVKQFSVEPRDIFEGVSVFEAGQKSPDIIDSLSGDAQSVFSQKSETISYKEKLRNRFLTVKKRAEVSIVEEPKPKAAPRKLTIPKDIAFENQERLISSKLSDYESKHERNHDDFDFFCKVFQREEDPKSPKSKVSSKDESEEITVDDNFSSREVLSDFFDVNFDTELLKVVPAEKFNFEGEKELFWLPNRKITEENNESSSQIEENEPEYKIDHVSKRQLHFLKEKCRKDENINWFSDKNELKILRDPRLEKTFKPIKIHSGQNDLIQNYIPLIEKEFLCEDINMYKNTLEIFISNIEINHHPLFSAEHILKQKIILICNEHNKILQKQKFEKYRKDLNTLRETKFRLEKEIGSEGVINDNQLTTLKNLREEIKMVREKFHKFSLKEKHVKTRLIFYWKTLKQLRLKQEYSSTNIKLVINKQYNDYETEKKIWDNHIMFTVYEIFDEKEEIYQSELKEYKVKSKEWKLKFKQLNENEDSDAIEVLPEKPTKPNRDFSDESIRENVVELCGKHLKPPGEPILNFQLNFEHEVTENINDKNEELRRKEFDKTKIFLKIIYNDREICSTKSVSLEEDFKENISLRISKIPHTLSVQIYEKSNLVMKHLVGEMKFEVPDINNIDGKIKFRKGEFLNENKIKLNHAGVGTGVTMNDILKNYDLEVEDGESILMYSGVITYGLTWLKETNHETLEEVISESTTPSKSQEKIEEKPKTPDNQTCLETTKIAELEFCEMEEIENNPRLKLLELRFHNEPEYKDIVVPIRIREISSDIFLPYERRLKEEHVILTLNNDEENINERRKWAQKFLRQVENKVLQLSKIAEEKLTLKDVLDEENGPTLGSLGSNFVNFLQPNRPLRPKRKPVKKNPVTGDVKQVKVIVNIVGASQIPVRNDDDRSKIEYIFMANVRPFVVVTLGDVSVRTSVAEGPNPIWNQELILPLKVKSYSSSPLQSLQGTLIINLYDETVEDLLEDDRLRENNIHQRLGCNWLGNLEIPLTALLTTTKIEGTFQLNLPPILVGYDRQKKTHHSAESFIQKSDTFLTLFAALHPAPKNLNKRFNDDLKSIETEKITEHITEWQNNFNSQFPQRSFASSVTNIGGERCSVTRFVKPLKASYLHDDMFEVSESQCARYVAFIPFSENFINSDIWLSPEQLLILTLGSVRDHSTLLASYFLGLDIEAWLLLGYGVPNGYTAFVFTKQNNDYTTSYYIYDVLKGIKYNIYDHTSPLKKVFCVINNKNVWANIQTDDRIHLTKFDFNNSSNWRPLFSKETTAPEPTFEKVNIVFISESIALQLQEKIEKKIKKHFMSWRKHSRTIWNYYCSAVFKRVLVKIEESYPESVNESENLSELENILSSFKIYGFATSFSYTSVKDIVEAIRLRGIHLNENPNVEFALSVHIQRIFNNVVVWIYLASLLKRR